MDEPDTQSVSTDPQDHTVTGNIPLPFVSVAVVIKNEARHIRACLESLMNQDYPGDRFEVLVIEGGSSDGTVQIVEEFLGKFSNLKLMNCPGCSYPAGLNIGVRAAQGEIWAFVDGHASIQTDFLSKNVKYLMETGAACVGGVIHTTGEGYVGAAIAHALSTPFGAGNAKFRHSSRYVSKAAYVDTVPFGAYRKERVEAAGFFDESRLRSADIDLNHRIRDLGGRFYLSPDIRTCYYSRPTLRSMMRQAFSNGYPLAKTLNVASPRHFAPALFVGSLATTLVLLPIIPPAKLVFSLVAGVYVLCDVLFSALTASEHGWRYLPVLLVTYPLLHISYGLGSLTGFFREFFRVALATSLRICGINKGSGKQ